MIMGILPSTEHIPKEGKKSLIPQNKGKLMLEHSHASPRGQVSRSPPHTPGVKTEHFNGVTKPDRKLGQFKTSLKTKGI